MTNYFSVLFWIEDIHVGLTQTPDYRMKIVLKYENLEPQFGKVKIRSLVWSLQGCLDTFIYEG